MNSNQLRYLFIALSILIATGLFFAPSQINSKPKTTSVEKEAVKEISEEKLIASAKESLKDEQRRYIAALESQLNSDSSKLSLYDSLGSAWDEAKVPAASAYYFELKAKRIPTEDNYLKAAYRYFDAWLAWKRAQP